jgi:hypothetical protein
MLAWVDAAAAALPCEEPQVALAHTHKDAAGRHSLELLGTALNTVSSTQLLVLGAKPHSYRRHMQR